MQLKCVFPLMFFFSPNFLSLDEEDPQQLSSKNIYAFDMWNT